MKIDCSIIEGFEQKFGKEDAFQQAQQFVIAYLSLIKAPLPLLAKQSWKWPSSFEPEQ
jgi:hypothetical protein